MWLLSWLHNDVMPEFHALAGYDSNSSMFGIGKKQAFKILPRSDFIRQVCHSWAKTLHSVKILYQHVKPLCAICIQRTRWLAAKQTKLGTGCSVRRGRRTRDYLQRQTASVSI